MNSDKKVSQELTTLSPECPIMVMLVDDQAIVGEAVRRLLAREHDMDLHYCSNAQVAVEQAIQIKPTVILLDLVMPTLDGFEVLRRFRANPVTAHVPIVVLSTTEEPETKSRAFTGGADDYLVKLPDKIELIARVRYHSKSYLNLVQRDEAYRALRESQQQLLDSNTALTNLNHAYHQAKEEADRANMAKSEFLSRMSHELRTPLNAILGFSQILEMEDLKPMQQESVQHIMKAGTHLLGLINEMLDIARVEAGRISLTLEGVQVSKAIHEAKQLIQPMSSDFNVRIHNLVEEDCQYHALADRQRLKQVLLNLLSNAVKYNLPGGTVSISCVADQNDGLRIDITDTGEGISEADMERLFVPFERLKAEASGVEGTGLGLTLSKRLVEAMNGSLKVSSLPGLGSTFSIILPLASDHADAVNEVTVPKHNTPTIEFFHRSVLLIEDNLPNIKLIEAIFKDHREIDLLTAMQGSVGVEMAQQHRPDLILLDLHLPDMSGRDVLALLQQCASTSSIPVIIVSADATTAEQECLLAAGARLYLTKPLNIEAFNSAITAVFQEEKHE